MVTCLSYQPSITGASLTPISTTCANLLFAKTSFDYVRTTPIKKLIQLKSRQSYKKHPVRKKRPVNLTIETDKTLQDTEILIRCAAVDEQITGLIASIRMHDHHLIGKHNSETIVIPIGIILYIETVDRHTFAYTYKSVIEINSTISELENNLANTSFVRTGKSCLINLYRVKSLRPYVGGRLLARLDNNEEVIVSRMYAKELKRRLGV